MVITEGDMIRLGEFVHLYCLKESKKYGYYKLVHWVRKARVITIFLRLSNIGSPGSCSCLEMVGKHFLMTSSVKVLDCFVGGGPRD